MNPSTGKPSCTAYDNVKRPTVQKLRPKDLISYAKLSTLEISSDELLEMTLEQFLKTLRKEPENIEFEDTISVIDAEYTFTPTSFSNGDVKNAANENNGSCKIFAFAQLQSLDADQTLACFGRYYREDVLKNPEGTDHSNIRSFMANGWIGIEFDGMALTVS